MDEIGEKVRGFIAESKNPNDKDIDNFITGLETEYPSVELGNLKKNIIKLLKQDKEIAAIEKELSSLDKNSPDYDEFIVGLNEAKEGQRNLEDISDLLKTAKNILKIIKEEKSKKKESKEINIKKNLKKVKQILLTVP